MRKSTNTFPMGSSIMVLLDMMVMPIYVKDIDLIGVFRGIIVN